MRVRYISMGVLGVCAFCTTLICVQLKTVRIYYMCMCARVLYL